MRSTISATIATATQSAILAKKTPPTPIGQIYCISNFISYHMPALFSIFTFLQNAAEAQAVDKKGGHDRQHKR